MSNSETRPPPICDDSGLAMPPKIVATARRWLMWRHGLTGDEAAKVMVRAKGYSGPTRQRQRSEAISVADFVYNWNKEPPKSDAEHIRDILKRVEHFR